MDSINKKQIYLKQIEQEHDLEIAKCYENFKSEISPLFDSDIQFYVHRIISDRDLLKHVELDPYQIKLSPFTFNSHGSINFTELKNTIKLNQDDIAASLKSIQATMSLGDARVTVLWKSHNPVLEISFNDLLSVANDILNTSWEIYIFDMFSNWVIELHHDGYISYGEL